MCLISPSITKLGLGVSRFSFTVPCLSSGMQIWDPYFLGFSEAYSYKDAGLREGQRNAMTPASTAGHWGLSI